MAPVNANHHRRTAMKPSRKSKDAGAIAIDVCERLSSYAHERYEEVDDELAGIVADARRVLAVDRAAGGAAPDALQVHETASAPQGTRRARTYPSERLGRVTVPPTACQACGGYGNHHGPWLPCKECGGTGENVAPAQRRSPASKRGGG
jgi:hypothetical protein